MSISKKESDIVNRIQDHIRECTERELVELYNCLFKTDLHTSQVNWGIYNESDTLLNLPARDR